MLVLDCFPVSSKILHQKTTRSEPMPEVCYFTYFPCMHHLDFEITKETCSLSKTETLSTTPEMTVSVSPQGCPTINMDQKPPRFMSQRS